MLIQQTFPTLDLSDVGRRIFVPNQTFSLSTRKINELKKIAEIQNYYQCNPVKFIQDFFNIQLLDAQAWIITRAWNCPNVLLVCTRGFGKSTLVDLLIMSKQMLSQNWVYIASGSGSQAEQTFTTLEKIANDRIDSMVGSTGQIFKNEVEIKNAAGDGFSHSSDGFTYNLFNGSFTKTLNSNVDKRRGARSNIVIFDECAWLDADMLEVYKAFTIVDKNFKTGSVDGKTLNQIRLKSMPDEIPNQLIYISSASSTDTEYYRLYRDFSKRMLMGDPNYFVAHIDCEVAMHPTIHGELSAPLLTKEKVETALRTNPEKARREYYCEFTSDAGTDAIIKRSAIVRNERVYKPIMFNDTGERKIVITYDPARSRDNSVILVCEIYEGFDANGDKEQKLRILRCINLIDIAKKRKSPMQTPDQIEYLKEIILEYNMGGDDSYSNIYGIWIDAGSGGGGVNIADYLMADWKGPDGKIHRGLIDREYSADYVNKFPNAVDKVHLMSPTQYKSEMYEAAIELTNQNKIEFTASYDNKGYLTVFDVNEEMIAEKTKEITEKLKKKKTTEEELQLKLQEELQKLQSVTSRIEKLDWQDEVALASIDALKEELVNMVRIKRESGKDSFELCADKRTKLHDDRAYTYVMAAYALQQARKKDFLDRSRKQIDNMAMINSLPFRKARTIY